MKTKLLTLLLTISFLFVGGNAMADETRHHPLDESEDSSSINPLDDAIAGPRRRVRRRRVYRRSYRPRYHSRSRVVVAHHHTAPVHSRPTVVSRPKGDSRISLGLRFLGLNMEDTALSVETFEGATLAGIGGYLRAKVDKNWGIEVSADVLGASESAYDQVTLPVMVGLMAHLFPDSTLDIYGIAGGGILFTEIDYTRTASNQASRESYTQGAAQLGGGLEIDLGALELIGDIRWLIIQSRPERDQSIRDAAPLDNVDQDSDDFTNALQFTLGLGGNF